ncbi:hypothetical protein L7F22_015962, partial [Adiantum nelumboides]|nr:hypothetical protein [Adiantum nelumboides]
MGDDDSKDDSQTAWSRRAVGAVELEDSLHIQIQIKPQQTEQACRVKRRLRAESQV